MAKGSRRVWLRVWLVAVVVLVGALAYGAGRFGWLQRSDTPEPATPSRTAPEEPAGRETETATPAASCQINVVAAPLFQSDEEIIQREQQSIRDTEAQREELARAAQEATSGLDAASAEAEDLIEALDRAQAAVDAQQAALEEAERAVVDALAVVRAAEVRITELEDELLTAQENRPGDIDALRQLGEEIESCRLLATDAVAEAEAHRRDTILILADLQAAADLEAELSLAVEERVERRLYEVQTLKEIDAQYAAEIEAAEREIAAALARQRVEEEARRRVEEEARRRAELSVHPEVQAQGEALALEVVEKHRGAWPWVQSAWDRTEVVFFDGRLPEPCAGAWACALSGPEVWFTLDSVRDDEDREHVVLHELGHVASTSPEWSELVDGFSDHFVGCYSARASAETLPEELLVDAVVQAMRFGRFPTGYGYYNGWDFTSVDGGSVFEDETFSGCLVDASAPPEHLVELVWSLSSIGEIEGTS